MHGLLHALGVLEHGDDHIGVPNGIGGVLERCHAIGLQCLRLEGSAVPGAYLEVATRQVARHGGAHDACAEHRDGCGVGFVLHDLLPLLQSIGTFVPEY
ncbi:hypothetical protein SDC9_107441 [bioreactor metagenome]|uniref:Uncharacterized protein n=1 Tax=bioreactor metagenome TaxID=1076179 RepID=A0A645B579_9ZZZZ